MNEGGMKPFEEMTREELIEAAKFRQAEYERMAHEQWSVEAPAESYHFTWYSKCGSCGLNHDPKMSCMPLPGGGAILNMTFTNR